MNTSSVHSEAPNSFHPREAAPTRLQDRSKFVSRYSVRPLAAVELEARMSALESSCSLLIHELGTICSAAQWATVGPDALLAFSDPLTKLSLRFSDLTTIMYGSGGLVEYVACANADQRLTLAARMHNVGIDILLSSQKITKLQECKQDPAFIAAYRRLKDAPTLELVERACVACSGEYGFWTKAGYLAKKWHDWGYYQETARVAMSLEKDIQRPTAAIIQALEQQIKSSEIPNNQALKDLEALFPSKLEEVRQVPDDGLKGVLIEYTIGLGYGLKHARFLYSFYLECSEHALFEAEAALRGYSSGDINALYKAMLKMKEANQYRPSEHSRDPLERFVYNSTLFYDDIHAKLGQELLELTEDEVKVPACVFSGIATAHLEAYVRKRILQLKFLPFRDYDIELELVLYLSERNLSYQLTESDLFKDYQARIVAPEERARAVKMAAKIVQVDSQSSYLEAWHYFFVHFRNATKELSDTFIGWLNKHPYGALYPEVYCGLDSWHVTEPALFLQELHNAVIDPNSKIPGLTDKEKTQNLFQSLMLRILAAELYEKEPKQKHLAHTMKQAMLTYGDFTLPAAFDPLLLDAALETLLCGGQIREREKLLVDAALDRYRATAKGSKLEELVAFSQDQDDSFGDTFDASRLAQSLHLLVEIAGKGDIRG